MDEYSIYDFLEKIESYDSEPPEFILLRVPYAEEDNIREHDKPLYESVMKALVIQFPSADSQQGYIPAISFQNRWRHIEEQDFTKEDFERLTTLQMDRIPLHVQTRILDVFWIINKHYPSAIKAIDGYQQLFQQCFSIDNWVDSIDLIVRAINITRDLRKR